MKKFLFIYSLVITLGLTFYFAFLFPSKTTLIISLLMLPIPAYFFILLTHPKDVGVPKWSLRVLLFIFLLSFLAIASFKFLNINGNTNQSPLEEDNTSIYSMQENKATKSPTPTAKDNLNKNNDFTDILMEESKKTLEPEIIVK